MPSRYLTNVRKILFIIRLLRTFSVPFTAHLFGNFLAAVFSSTCTPGVIGAFIGVLTATRETHEWVGKE